METTLVFGLLFMMGTPVGLMGAIPSEIANILTLIGIVMLCVLVSILPVAWWLIPVCGLVIGAGFVTGHALVGAWLIFLKRIRRR